MEIKAFIFDDPDSYLASHLFSRELKYFYNKGGKRKNPNDFICMNRQRLPMLSFNIWVSTALKVHTQEEGVIGLYP
jgi:hypothetical protein